jgi:hypothetical protein
MSGVAVLEQASVKLDKCTARSNKMNSVQAESGAVVNLTGCSVADSLEGSGLVVVDEGTRVVAKESTFEGSCMYGVAGLEQASVQLDKCTARSNKMNNVLAGDGAVVNLTGCTVADCLEGSGLGVVDEGTRVVANESTFEGNCESGVFVKEQARVQLDKCTVRSNKRNNVEALSGAVVNLTGCTVADSLERNGLLVAEEGTRVMANESTFEGNCWCGMVVLKQASVQLDKCTFQNNKQARIANENGTVMMNGERILKTSWYRSQRVLK